MSEPLKMDRMKVIDYKITLDKSLEPLDSFHPNEIIRSCVLFWSEVTFSLVRNKFEGAKYRTNTLKYYNSYSCLVAAFSGTNRRILYGLLCQNDDEFEVFLYFEEPGYSDNGFTIEQIENDECNGIGDKRWIRPSEIKLEYLHEHPDRLSEKGRVLDFKVLEGPRVRRKDYRDPVSAIFWKNTTFDPVECILCPYYEENEVKISSNRFREKIRDELELAYLPEKFDGDILLALWNKYFCTYSSEISNCATVNDKHDRSQSNPAKQYF